MLSGRRVVLGVSGGVAAYKSAYLARRLLETGAEVRVVMTPAAQRFIGAQTFASLTGSHPLTDLFEDPSVSPHTELARWAELVIVAPATAATIARLAHGIADNALAATLLATRAPVVLAPAMHTEMWEHPATRRNISLIEADGHRIIGPFSGELAGGDVGIGRVAEPEEIVEFAKTVLHRPLEGLTVLVTAGGTREALDPVRYLGNRSSGKMGHAIAAAAAQRGAHVELVTTSSLPAPPGANVHRVEPAQEMLEAVEKIHPDIAVFAAAVADSRPAHAAHGGARSGARPRRRRLRGRVRRRGRGSAAGGRGGEAQGRGPDGLQRRQRPRLGVRNRHQPGHSERAGRDGGPLAAAVQGRGG